MQARLTIQWTRGETATLLKRSFFNSELRGGGFAPRHLNRSVLSGFNRNDAKFRQNLYCLLLNLL